MRGVPCKLLCAKRRKQEPLMARKQYHRLKVVQQLSTNILQSEYADALFSRTFYLFYPQSILDAHPEMVNWTDVEVDCGSLKEVHSFHAIFPSFGRDICWASGVGDETMYVNDEAIFVIAETCFEKIKNDIDRFC